MTTIVTSIGVKIPVINNQLFHYFNDEILLNLLLPIVSANTIQSCILADRLLPFKLGTYIEKNI